MTRWITFDGQSAAALAAAQILPELHDSGDARGVALSSSSSGSLVLMPASTPGQVLVLQVRHVPPPKGEPEVQYEATGFLGLMDAPVYEDDQPAKPRRWWQRIWD